MTVRPIIFSGPMVRALLDGRKTQTRRLASSPLAKCQPGDILNVKETHWRRGRYVADWNIVKNKRVWRFEPVSAAEDRAFLTFDPKPRIDRESEGWHKRPSIFMPRWASRLTLEVTGVKVEPLQAISRDDAIAEGIERLKSGRGFYDPRFGHGGVHLSYCETAPSAFGLLWDSLHKPGHQWADNPDVVALTFKVHKCNVDQFRPTSTGDDHE